MKTWLRIGLSVFLSVLFMWLAFRHVDFASALRLVRQADLPLICAYVVSLIFLQLARAIRWQILVRPFASLSTPVALRISNLGAMLVLVLPLRLGEFSRPYLLKKECGAPASAGLGSVVVERVLDGLLVTLFFFIATMVSSARQHVPAGLLGAAFVALGLFVGLAGVIGCALLWRDRVLSLIARLVSRVSSSLAERAVGMLTAFIDGLRFLPNLRAVVGVVGWTGAYWAVSGLGYYFVMRAFGWALPLTAAFMVLSIVVIAIMVPAGPGFLGTYQAGLTAGLAIYAIDVNAAAAYGLVVYPLNVLVVVASGLPHLFAKKTRLFDLMHGAQEGGRTT